MAEQLTARRRLTAEEKYKARRETWRKSRDKTANLRISRDTYGKWNILKAMCNAETNDAFAMLILEKWESSLESNIGLVTDIPTQITPSTSHGTQHSTPVRTPTAHAIPHHVIQELGVSDISGPDEPSSELSGVTSMSMERYEEKAKQTKGSFLDITIESTGAKQKDVSYRPTLSEEEAIFEDDEMSDSFSEDEDDFEMEMSIRNGEENVEELPIIFHGDDLCGTEDAEEETDSDSDSDQDHPMENVRSIVDDQKAICFLRELCSLAKTNVSGKCNRKGCAEGVDVEVKTKGTSAVITWKCQKGHKIRTWYSQPKIKRRPAGDLLLTSSILCSGNNYEKIKLLFKFFGLGMTAAATHYQFQSHHCVPVIKDQFSKTMERNRAKYMGKEVVVAGDGRMDSPGHSAQYCTYTLLEYESKDILACEIINKRETDMKSTIMENEGLRRSLKSLLDAGLIIKEVCTDASTSITSLIAKENPNIQHSYDTWHGAKNLGKKLAAVAAEKDKKELREWVPRIINHFWYCSRTSNGDENKILASWRGVLHHVVNVHEWALGDGVSAARCDHDQLADDGDEPKWLEPGGPAHAALTKFALDTRFLHNLHFYKNFRHTGELESFHDHILMYCAKRFAYTYPVYKARNYLACIDYQHHLNRPVWRNNNGEVRLHRKYSKKNNNWTSCEQKMPKEYKYIPELQKAIFQNFMDSDFPLTAKVQLTPSDPRKTKRHLSIETPPPTKSLMEQKRSRFGDKE